MTHDAEEDENAHLSPHDVAVESDYSSPSVSIGLAVVPGDVTKGHMEETDRFEIDDILAQVKADEYGLRTMVVEGITSEIFRSR